jgi:hypothetical protein
VFVDRPWSNHANMVSDGDTLLGDAEDYFEYVSRALIQLLAYVVVQIPVKYRARFSRDRALSCFSMVVNGKRIVASPWSQGPGWAESDCQEGPAPPVEEDADQERMYQLQASDDPEKQKFPFGNPELNTTLRTDFDKLIRGAESSIPLCNLSMSGKRDGSTPGGRNCKCF